MNDRLRAARLGAGFKSAADAARALGIGESAYRAHENGQNDYGLEDCRRYARKFGVRASWLCFGEDPMQAPEASVSLEEAEFMRRLGGLDPERRAKLILAFEGMLEVVNG